MEIKKSSNGQKLLGWTPEEGCRALFGSLKDGAADKSLEAKEASLTPMNIDELEAIAQALQEEHGEDHPVVKAARHAIALSQGELLKYQIVEEQSGLAA